MGKITAGHLDGPVPLGGGWQFFDFFPVGPGFAVDANIFRRLGFRALDYKSGFLGLGVGIDGNAANADVLSRQPR